MRTGACGVVPMSPITSNDRIVIVAPHPDDEVLGAGGLIQQALAVGADVRVIYLTNGDHNQVAFKLYSHKVIMRPRQYREFGERRRAEAESAMKLLGLPPDHQIFLGFPDYGTMSMWLNYWDEQKTFRSDATQVSAVPYPDAYKPNLPYKSQNIAAALVELFRQFRPTRIVVTHQADTNGDHRAAANFVRLAVLDMAPDGPQPTLYYYLVHFGHWPLPYHLHPELTLDPPRALLDDGHWEALSLTPEQVKAKHQAIMCNRTQLSKEYYLIAFARANELFAVIEPARVPVLPFDTELDWKKAVRNKVLEFAPNSAPPKLDEQLPAALLIPAVELEGTDFLRQGDDLIAQIVFRNRLGKRTGVHLYLFGYNRSVSFAKLPKLDVYISPRGNVSVFDSAQRFRDEDIKVTCVANRCFVRVPLRLLAAQMPAYLFTATRAHLGELSPGDTAWQWVDLQTPPIPSSPQQGKLSQPNKERI